MAGLDGIRFAARDILVPLFFLYIGSLFFILQDFFPANSEIILIFKLLTGTVILGGFSLWITRKCNISNEFFFPTKIRWGAVTFSLVSALFMVYSYLFLRDYVFTTHDYLPGIDFYGHHEHLSASFFILILCTLFYVFSEEVFFRGIVYRYAKNIFNKHLVAATIFATLVFVLVHLDPAPPLVFILTMMPVINIFFLEKTGTLFYGFLTHAFLNLTAILIFTDLGDYIVKDVPSRFVFFMILVLGSVFVYLARERFSLNSFK